MHIRNHPNINVQMQSLADVVIVGRECHLVHGASDPIPRVHEAECLADRCEEAHLADGIEPRQIAALSQTNCVATDAAEERVYR